VLNNVLEEGLPEKEKAQAEKPAPKFISIFRITSPEGNYDMFSGFILCVESSTWRELGALGGLTKFLGRERFLAITQPRLGRAGSSRYR
jgi:hypothetical protein